MLWIIAGYIGHPSPATSTTAKLASVLALIGLFVPMIAAFGLIDKDADPKNDWCGRLTNFVSMKPVYPVLACFLMLAGILRAQQV
jgi:hypothetical protein